MKTHPSLSRREAMKMLDCFPVGFTFGMIATLIFFGVILRATSG